MIAAVAADDRTDGGNKSVGRGTAPPSVWDPKRRWGTGWGEALKLETGVPRCAYLLTLSTLGISAALFRGFGF